MWGTIIVCFHDSQYAESVALRHVEPDGRRKKEKQVLIFQLKPELFI